MRVFSGIQPTGEPTLGTLLGALRPFAALQGPDAYYCIVDLHALTVQPDRRHLKAASYDVAATMIAAGIDPARSALFAQSAVPEHPRLSWLLACTASYGELKRMTQFKDKSAKGLAVSAGLLTYPVLMAADILLYQAEAVPVGHDQKQHVELTRDLAQRFNSRCGSRVFTVPEPLVTEAAPRIRDLQNPTAKMSKSEDSAGTISVSDAPDLLRRKVARAVTDAEGEVRFDPEAKPGVSNLLTIYAAIREIDQEAAAKGFTGYKELKDGVAEALVEFLGPIQERRADLLAHPTDLDAVLAEGARKAGSVAARTYAAAAQALGVCG